MPKVIAITLSKKHTERRMESHVSRDSITRFGRAVNGFIG
jgi:hypothetical protein